MYHSSRPRFGLLRLAVFGFIVYIFFRGLVSVLGTAALVVPFLWFPLVFLGVKVAMAAAFTRRLGPVGPQVDHGWRDGRYVTVERRHRESGPWRRSSRWDRSERSDAAVPPPDPDWERAKREALEEIEREFPDPQAP